MEKNKMNQRNKELDDVLGYFNGKLKTEGIAGLGVEYLGKDGGYIVFNLPDNEVTQRAMGLHLTHSSRIPDEAMEYVALATALRSSGGICNFQKILEYPRIGEGVPGLTLARRLFEDEETKANLFVYPSNGSLGDLLDVEFNGEEITNKSAGTWRYRNRLDRARDMREVINLAFDIYNS